MKKQIGIIVSQFNNEVTHKLLTGALSRLTELKIKDSQIHIHIVPGAVEIPLTAKLMAKSKKFSSIICLGAVIRGETDHYDVVCEMVSRGCLEVMMDFEIPIIFGVLTTKNTKQALARAGGKHGNKGIEAVDAVIQMMKIKLDYT